MDRGRRAGGRALSRRPRGAGGRRRAPVHADRRLRHEHRHGRRLQSRPGSLPRWCKAGAEPGCCNPTRPSGGRSPSATPSRRASLNKHLIAMPAPPEMEDDTPAGAAARRVVSAHLATMGEEFASIGVQLGARYDGSPIVAEDGAPPPDDYRDLHAVRRAGRPRAALLAGPGPRHWRLAVRPLRQGLHAASLQRQGGYVADRSGGATAAACR